jgi:hypothetical protein
MQQFCKGAQATKRLVPEPISAQAEAGNVKIVRGLWNDEFLRVPENFPAGKHDDEVDALSGAHGVLVSYGGPVESESVVIPGRRSIFGNQWEAFADGNSRGAFFSA